MSLPERCVVARANDHGDLLQLARQRLALRGPVERHHSEISVRCMRTFMRPWACTPSLLFLGTPCIVIASLRPSHSTTLSAVHCAHTTFTPLRVSIRKIHNNPQLTGLKANSLVGLTVKEAL